VSKAVINEAREVLLPLAASPSLSPAPPLRVLHVHSGNIYGGVETMLLTQARSRDLCPAMELSFALCFAGRLNDELTALGAAVYQLGQVRIRQPLSVRRARLALRELLRREAFDAIVTHSCWSQAIFGPAAHAVSVPLVFYLHAPSPGRHWLERWARRTMPDVVLCNSQFTAATLSQLYPRTKSETLYYPVAPQKLGYSETDIKDTRTELQTPLDATVIIQVSRMETLKGHLLHLEALSLIKDLPDWVCWQVGGAQRPDEVQYLAELKLAAARLGIAERVRFLNERSDVERLLAAADIYCQPNLDPESFGISFIEALYAQLPVVTSNIGGAREILDDSCGMLVPPGDAPAVATALRLLSQDQALRLSMGTAGPQRALALCDPAARLNQFHEALGCVIRQPTIY
jgi:glycosyltransferase involved in cell wall biosynthesis